MKQISTVQGPFWVFDQDQVGAVLAGQQFWDWQLLPEIDRVAKESPGGWAIDLGACFGWFTVYLARRFRQVLAVEMHPATYGLLQKNLTFHGLTNVQTVQGAAWDTEEGLRLARPEEIGWPVPDNLDLTPNPSSLGLLRAVAGEAVFCPSGPVDGMIPPDAKVVFIKVDVQGADLRALKGLRKTIARCRPTICFEFEGGPSSWHGDDWSAYVRFFDEMEYQISPLESNMDHVARPR